MPLDLGFFGHLAQRAASAASAWRAGERIGQQEAEARRIRDEDRAEKKRQEQKEEELRDLQTRRARVELDAAEKKSREPSHEGHVHGPRGTEFGADSPDARKNLLQFEKDYHDATTNEPREAQGPDPFARRQNEMEYWASRAAALVEQEGGYPGSAINAAMDRNKNPEFREAIRSGRAQRGSFYEAARKRSASSSSGKGQVPQALLDEWAAQGLTLTQVYEKAKSLGYAMK